MRSIFKNWKIILVITLTFTCAILLYVSVIKCKIKKIDIKDINEIDIKYNFRYDSDLPNVVIKLDKYEKEDILKQLDNYKLVIYDNKAKGADNYEVILNDKTKFTFQYEDLPNWFGNNAEFFCNWYEGTEVFVTKLPVYVLSKIVKKVDNELLRRNKEFKTDKLTIKTSSDSITLEDSKKFNEILKEAKNIVEISEIEENEIKYTLDFNNGTILQICGPIEFDDNGIMKLKGKKYGKVITNGKHIKNVQIPHLMIFYIYNAIVLFGNT